MIRIGSDTDIWNMRRDFFLPRKPNSIRYLVTSWPREFTSVETLFRWFFKLGEVFLPIIFNLFFNPYGRSSLAHSSTAFDYCLTFKLEFALTKIHFIIEFGRLKLPALANPITEGAATMQPDALQFRLVHSGRRGRRRENNQK